MQVAAISAIADFKGNNASFRAELVKNEKFVSGGGRSFAEIFADAKRKLK